MYYNVKDKVWARDINEDADDAGASESSYFSEIEECVHSHDEDESDWNILEANDEPIEMHNTRKEQDEDEEDATEPQGKYLLDMDIM